MPDISIMFTARDNLSAPVKKMGKSVQELTDTLAKERQTLADLKKARLEEHANLLQSEVAYKKAASAFKEYNNEVNRAALMEKQAAYEGLKDHYKELGDEAKATRKHIAALEKEIEELHKAEALAKSGGGAAGCGGSASGGGGSSNNSWFWGTGGGRYNDSTFLSGRGGRMAAMRLLRQLGSSVSSYAGASFDALYGAETGSTISSVLGGAAQGAAAGVMSGNPIVVAAGGVIGAASGLISDIANKKQNETSAFRSVLSSKYDELIQQQADMLLNGLDVVSGRESDYRAFLALGRRNANGLSVSEYDRLSESATDFQNSLVELGRGLNVSYNSLSSIARELLGIGYDYDKVLRELTAYENVAGTLGWTESQFNSFVSAISGLRQGGNVNEKTMETFRAMGIDAWGYLTAATGYDQSTILANIKDLSGSATANAIVAGLMGDQQYANGMQYARNTYEGAKAYAEAYADEMDAARAEAYQAERQKGYDADIAFYEQNGEFLKDVYASIGRGEAEAENYQQELLRNQISTLLSSAERFDEFMNSSPEEQKRMLMGAQAQAEAEYVSSDMYATIEEANKQLVSDLENSMSLKEAWKHFGYTMAQEIASGMQSYAPSGFAINFSAPSESGGLMGSEVDRGNTSAEQYALTHPRASGQAVIPYDGFPILAHQGEVLLTAGQARALKDTPSVTLGGTYYIREDADIARVAEELYGLLQSAQESYVGA